MPMLRKLLALTSLMPVRTNGFFSSGSLCRQINIVHLKQQRWRISFVLQRSRRRHTLDKTVPFWLIKKNVCKCVGQTLNYQLIQPYLGRSTSLCIMQLQNALIVNYTIKDWLMPSIKFMPLRRPNSLLSLTASIVSQKV